MEEGEESLLEFVVVFIAGESITMKVLEILLWRAFEP